MKRLFVSFVISMKIFNHFSKYFDLQFCFESQTVPGYTKWGENASFSCRRAHYHDINYINRSHILKNIADIKQLSRSQFFQKSKINRIHCLSLQAYWCIHGNFRVYFSCDFFMVTFNN